jgi:hypothetical protein
MHDTAKGSLSRKRTIAPVPGNIRLHLLMGVKNSLQVVLPWSLSLPKTEGERRQFHETTICIFVREKLNYFEPY